MRVSSISTSNYAPQTPSVEDVKAQLQQLADQHDISVDELLSSARSASKREGYQSRALNLEQRIKTLESR